MSLYAAEVRSTQVERYIKTCKDELWISSLTQVEFYSAVNIKKRMKALSLAQAKHIIQLFEQHIAQRHFILVHLTHEVYDLAKTILYASKVALRSLDALHLACAKQHHLELITADKMLHLAANKCDVQSVLLEQ